MSGAILFCTGHNCDILYIMLYILPEIDIIGESIIDRSLPLLSDERREKVLRMQNMQGKILSSSVYLLLRFALREEYDIDEAVSFIYNGHGKPALSEHQHIHFNLSHCRNAAACVISNIEAGVDIQDIRPVSDAVAKRVLTAEEYTEFRAAENPEAYFCEIWAIKECRLKQTGKGLNTELSQLTASKISDISIIRNAEYICCVSGADTCVRYVNVKELI